MIALLCDEGGGKRPRAAGPADGVCTAVAQVPQRRLGALWLISRKAAGTYSIAAEMSSPKATSTAPRLWQTLTP
ncbi:hypothetical protein DEM34_15490 [Spiribacter halobius]|uniref:Uncharacterized protein n=1 Tax=Sediminicurvatus halobius TaxID=2182432 RepID=A0A2U2MXH8_9GAMM|nr:hypothetical protein DEM34_15490 [Spiribacter halobius]